MPRAEQISRRVKLRHLNVLQAVVEQGSMGKAADKLAVSQPVVSKAIADLERLVGQRLLDRGPQGVEVTVYGRALLRRSVTIFDDLRASISELESLADPGSGDLRVGATEAMGTTLVPAVIDRLTRQYPRITFDVMIGGDPTSLLDSELRGRRVDLVIGRFEPDTADDLDVIPLFRDRLHIVTGASSAWVRRRRIALADLVNERWVLPPEGHPINGLVAGAFQRRGLPPPQRAITARQARVTSRLVAGGQFLGVLASAYLSFEDSRLPLKILPVDLTMADIPTSVVTLKNRTLSPIAKTFIETLHVMARPLNEGRSYGGTHK
jgi:DNA-binding transcriptional LysR family regulator